MLGYKIEYKCEKVIEELTDEILKFEKGISNKSEEILSKETIIAGGAIVNMIRNEEPNDYDIYFKSEESVNTVVKEIQYLDKNDDSNIKILFESKNAISFSLNEKKFQIIKRFVGKAEEIFESFDFEHCKVAYVKKILGGDLIYNKEQLELIWNKRLVYTGSQFPVSSIIRTRKFIKRGWDIGASQFLKMALQVNNLELNDISVLKDQLAGVDAMYFHGVIEQLEKEESYSINDLSDLLDNMHQDENDIDITEI